MSSIDDLLKAALDAMPAKPDESATQAQRKRYSEELSAKLSLAFATHLRGRGLEDARPAPPGVLGGSGAERRMSGGIGAKKVDVTWATAESGLILAISIKTINSRDRRTKNFQKNLVNRRGDMLMEAVTLHRRFPYAVLCGLMFLDVAAASDGTARRQSTFANAHLRLRLFTGRDDPADRDEQFELLYLSLFDAEHPSRPFRFFAVGKPDVEVDASKIINDLLDITAQRNPDLYTLVDGRLKLQR
jgi:hypothetical protein